MYRKPSKKKLLTQRIISYTAMVASVIAIVTAITLFVVGYRLDLSEDEKIEQYALIQFASTPSGATVKINDKKLSQSTPTKTSVPAGQYKVTMSLKGYKTWTKTINVKSGVLNWLNYALFIPKTLTTENVTNYTALSASIASPKGHYMIVQKNNTTPALDLVDLSSDQIKTTELIIPAGSYTDSGTVGVNHSFVITKWDNNERYVLVKHQYGEKYEWLIVDTKDINLTKNITTKFSLDISDVSFSGNSGNVFYALINGGDVRKVDFSSETISRALISKVESFSLYSSDVITYVGSDSTDTLKVVGLYTDGDSSSFVLKSYDKSLASNLHISTTRYFNENYIAITNGNAVEVLKGEYPTSNTEASKMTTFAKYNVSADIQSISFSPAGQYLLTRSANSFTTYDLEYKNIYSANVDGQGNYLKWFNDSHLVSDFGGKTTIREFDDTNINELNPSLTGQDVVMTNNKKYVYSLNTSAAGYQLQRVKIKL